MIYASLGPCSPTLELGIKGHGEGQCYDTVDKDKGG